MIFLLSVVVAACVDAAAGQQERMTFFLTSVGKGDGANLGGLTGADAHCGQLAADAGANSTGLVWRAYLSANGARITNVNARDRIGAGPWHNFRGVRVATDVANLHAANGTMNMLGRNVSLSERGTIINGRGETPLQHDILTGSTADGNLIGNATCNDWTSNATTGFVARVGHHDKVGGGEAPTSWNSAHTSRGCSQAALVGTGGAGLFYCFAQPGTSPTFSARTTTTSTTRTTSTTTPRTTSTTSPRNTTTDSTRPTRFTNRTTTTDGSSTTRGGASSTSTSTTTTTTTTTVAPNASGSVAASGASDAATTASGSSAGGSQSGSAAASGSETPTLPEAKDNSASESIAQVDSSASTSAMACSAVLAAVIAARV
jgi:hypothetical protein